MPQPEIWLFLQHEQPFESHFDGDANEIRWRSHSQSVKVHKEIETKDEKEERAWWRSTRPHTSSTTHSSSGRIESYHTHDRFRCWRTMSCTDSPSFDEISPQILKRTTRHSTEIGMRKLDIIGVGSQCSNIPELSKESVEICVKTAEFIRKRRLQRVETGRPTNKRKQFKTQHQIYNVRYLIIIELIIFFHFKQIKCQKGVTRLGFDKYTETQKALHWLTREITQKKKEVPDNEKDTIIALGDAKFAANSPIKGYSRCPHTKSNKHWRSMLLCWKWETRSHQSKVHDVSATWSRRKIHIWIAEIGEPNTDYYSIQKNTWFSSISKLFVIDFHSLTVWER